MANRFWIHDSVHAYDTRFPLVFFGNIPTAENVLILLAGFGAYLPGTRNRALFEQLAEALPENYCTIIVGAEMILSETPPKSIALPPEMVVGVLLEVESLIMEKNPTATRYYLGYSLGALNTLIAIPSLEIQPQAKVILAAPPLHEGFLEQFRNRITDPERSNQQGTIFSYRRTHGGETQFSESFLEAYADVDVPSLLRYLHSLVGIEGMKVVAASDDEIVPAAELFDAITGFPLWSIFLTGGHDFIGNEALWVANVSGLLPQ